MISRYKKPKILSLNFILSIGLAISLSSGFAGPCDELYKIFAELQAARSKEQQKKSGEFTCQGQIGTCWIHSHTGTLTGHLQRKSGEKQRFSIEFIYFHHIRNQIFDRLSSVSRMGDYFESQKVPHGYYDGGSTMVFERVIKKHGMLPKKEWHGPGINSLNINQQNKIRNQITNLLTAAKQETKDLASAFGHQGKDLFSANIQTKTSLIKEKYQKLITEILEKELGSPPKEFMFGNMRLTPVDYGSYLLNRYQLNKKDLPAWPDSLDGQKPYQRAVTEIKTEIANGNTVGMTLAWPSTKQQAETLLNDNHFHATKSSIPAHEMSFHAIQIINFKELADGRTQWIIRNSQDVFAKKYGGIMTISEAYFKAYAKRYFYYSDK
jgi:hypothetical protein